MSGFPHLFLYLAGWYHFPDICQDLFFSREGDIASTQNLLFSFAKIKSMGSPILASREVNITFQSSSGTIKIIRCRNWRFRQYSSSYIKKKSHDFNQSDKRNIYSHIIIYNYSHLFLYLAGWYHFPDICQDLFFSREGDIASTQNLLFSFKPIICKLTYSHVINTDSNLFQRQ
jgi:hypothetical protein